MAQQGIVIDGRAIQSERVRDLRVHQQHFSNCETFVFVPEPGVSGAPEAFMSAREKHRIFSAAGLKCSIFRVHDEGVNRAVDAVVEGKGFYIVQRPLLAKNIFPGVPPSALDLEHSSNAIEGMSALTETVLRVVRPFALRRRVEFPGEPVRVGVIGSNGFFGREISSRLTAEMALVHGLDQGDSPASIADTHIVISVVGRRGVVSRELLGKRKDLLVDVGYSYDEATGRGFGDFDSGCYENADYYTPVPGGIGPLQVLTLVERAARKMFSSLPYQEWALPDTQSASYRQE